ncbi:MAG: O-antigen ligase family protein [Acidimicrobiia bacterium]|nr:O-antigen ligase family protein [Acidimicrobiia bacterium]
MNWGQAIGAAFTESSTLVAVFVALMFLAAAVAGVRAYRRPYELVARPAPLGADTGLLPESRIVGQLEQALLFALAGYLFFDRAFAWIHVPGLPLFVGELVIVLGIVALLSTNMRLGGAVRGSGAFKALIGYMSWGALLLVGRITVYGQDAIRDAALWYYGIVAVFVVVLLNSRPARIERWVRLFGKAVPYFLIWFPIATVIDALFGDVAPVVPDSTIPITAHRTGNMSVMAAAGLGFLWLVDRDNEMYSERQRVGLTVLATIAILFAGMKNRGGFVAAAVALGVAAIFLRRKRSEISMVMVGAVVVLLIVGLLGNVRIALFSDDREVSVEQLLNNLTSIVDQDAGGSRQTTTTAWRLQIWEAVLRDVTTESPLTGFGPGPDLGERYGISGSGEEPLRNPHNSHVGVLARSGFVGVGLWTVMFLIWAVELLLARSRMLVRGHRVEAGIVVWLLVTVLAILVNAIFDPTLEGPQVAWWLWAMLGFGISLVTLHQAGRLPAMSLVEGREPLRPRAEEVTAGTAHLG